MPNKNKPKKESPYIQIRINPEEKEVWMNFAKENKFPSLSQLIKFSVNEIIERGIKITTDNSNNMSKAEEVRGIDELITILKEDRSEYMSKINEIILSFKESKDKTIQYTVKGQILKLLEKRKLKSEDIAEIFNIPESELLVILNDLMKRNIVILNKNMEYEVISNGNSK